MAYGDKRILEQQYASMKAWVEYMRHQAGDTHLWTTGFHFGDWLDYRGNPGDMSAPPITDKELIASAFYAYSTSLLQQAAEVLGKTDEAAEYAALLAKIKQAFVAEYVSENGRVASNSQSAYVLALHFDLLPEHMRQSAADRLAAQVKAFTEKCPDTKLVLAGYSQGAMLAALEAELLERINALGIGPQGLGGRTTALAVFIEEMPCHIASMPLAVNMQCHAQRHQTAEL